MTEPMTEPSKTPYQDAKAAGKAGKLMAGSLEKRVEAMETTTAELDSTLELLSDQVHHTRERMAALEAAQQRLGHDLTRALAKLEAISPTIHSCPKCGRKQHPAQQACSICGERRPPQGWKVS